MATITVIEAFERGRSLPICAVLALVLLLATPASAAAVPRGFFGVAPQGPLSEQDFDRMEGVVGTVRVPFDWSQVEPRPGSYDFAGTDELVGEAADHRVQVLPYVYGSPRWLSDDPARPPLDTARERAGWAAFLRRLVSRYGPRGAFWSGRGVRAPIRSWQIWNEPNFLLFWRPRPSPIGYARLLGISSRAIRHEDSHARIVTAGVAPVEAGMLPWEFLRRMYGVRGVRSSFDVVALHPYGGSVGATSYQLRRARRVMDRNGDRAKPLAVTELGVASDGSYANAFDKGRQGQARYLRRAYRVLLERRQRWHIVGVDWFAWQDAPVADPHCVFCQYAGLFDAEGRPKPAWRAFRKIAAEGAASKQRER